MEQDQLRQVDGGVPEDEELEDGAATDDAQGDAAGSSESTEPGQADLEQKATALGQQEGALQGELGELRRQLSRMESRFDRGGEDAAAIRDLRRQIGGIETRLEDIGELRETVDLVLRRSMEPEEWEQFDQRRQAKRKDMELARTKAERDALLKANEVRITPSPEQKPKALTPDEAEINSLAQDLDEAVKEAGFDPSDPAFQARVKAAIPNLEKMPVQDVVRAINRLLVRFVREDGASAREQQTRREARQSVQTDRARSGGGGRRFATLAEAEAAFARDEISPAEFRTLLGTLS